MYVAQKQNRYKKNPTILAALLFLFIFSISFYSFADNTNDEFIAYEVINGDTLWSISKKYNTPLKFILNINDVKDKDALSIGQIIKIPQDNLQAD
nr:LysM peptidoglycan-binding domain-containing protein [Bacteroidota bacterium]